MLEEVSTTCGSGWVRSPQAVMCQCKLFAALIEWLRTHPLPQVVLTSSKLTSEKRTDSKRADVREIHR